MEAEPRTVRMGISPRFADFIANAVGDREVDYLLGPASEPREERVNRFEQHAITYLIGRLMKSRGIDGSITDWALDLVPAEEDDR